MSMKEDQMYLKRKNSKLKYKSEENIQIVYKKP